MIPANATIIRKAYQEFANGNIPASLRHSTHRSPGMCRVIVRCRAITRATTKSSDFSNTPWHYAGVSSPSRFIMSLPKKT